MIKWIGISLGVLVGVSHIGMIGMISQHKQEEGLPVINIPESDYGTFQAQVTKDGYRVAYKANDPKTAYIRKDIKEKGGFLGLANNTTKVVEEYFMDGKTN